MHDRAGNEKKEKKGIEKLGRKIAKMQKGRGE